MIRPTIGEIREGKGKGQVAALESIILGVAKKILEFFVMKQL